MILYLDYNATAPVHPEVLEEMVRVYREEFGNAGSRTHAYGQRADQLVAQARGQIADLLAIDKHELIFTSGATESNNLAILGLAAWGAEQGRRHIVSTTIEHKAILEPLAHLAKQGFEIELVPVGLSGRVEADELLRHVRPDTLLVTMLHANNETGIIQPAEEIGAALADTPTYFHLDAAQTFGKEVEPLQRIRYDLLSISAHKIGGPQGIGGLVLRNCRQGRPPIRPIMFGGGQERGLRPGTLPVPLIVGFGTAAGLTARHHTAWSEQLRRTKASVLDQLQQIQHTLNGDQDHCLANCINVSFTGVDSEALMLLLKDEIALSNGAACTSADYASSHVLKAMGIPEEDNESAVRFSWGANQEIDLVTLIGTIQTMQ
jgi:cysteine desulfurase